MNKDKGFWKGFFDLYILYKFRKLILIGLIFIIIVGAIMFHDINKDLNKEPIEKGYSGFLDDIKYDLWTGEIIPKAEIYTYNNDNKYITNQNGEQIYFYKFKEKIEEYKNIQGQNAFLSEERKQQVTPILQQVINEYLGMEYTFTGSNEKLYQVEIQNYNKYGGTFGAGSSFESFVIENVKKIYIEQNELDK